MTTLADELNHSFIKEKRTTSFRSKPTKAWETIKKILQDMAQEAISKGNVNINNPLLPLTLCIILDNKGVFIEKWDRPQEKLNLTLEESDFNDLASIAKANGLGVDYSLKEDCISPIIAIMFLSFTPSNI